MPRPELFDRLDEATDGPLTLVTGPPGAGKTQLLSGWLSARPWPGPVAWLSLEPSDGRPVRFWGELIKLIRAALGVDAPPLPNPSPGVGDDFIASLGGAVNDLSPRLLIVLDDFEQLHSRAIIESLDLFLRIPQAGLRLVIASRLDPGLSLQRLRLEGRLAELRSGDLALNPEQAGELFELSGLTLSAEQVSTLHRRTEGWVGGLSLAALSLRGHPDPQEFVRTFAGDERTVSDYLIEEVLQQQPAAMRDFMLRTSVVEDLQADLADALTGRSDGAQALESLERSNAFLLPLDEHRHRYRYHPMFQELLRSQLRYRMPDMFALGHRRAARWFAANGAPAAAVQHAVAAGDAVTAANLLAEHWVSLMAVGQAQALADWVDGLPPRVVAGSAELALAGAGAMLALGQHEKARGFVALADSQTGAVAPKRRASYRFARAVVAMLDARVRGDYESTRTAAHKVLAAQQIAGAPQESRAMAHLSLGIVEHWSDEAGDGVGRIEEALELAERGSHEWLAVDCLGQLAMIKALGGSLRDAAGFGQAAVGAAARNGWEEQAVVAIAHLALAIAHFNWAELDEAWQQLERAANATRRSEARTTLSLIELFRGLLLGRANPAQGTRTIHAARNNVIEWKLPPRLVVMAGCFEAALLADAGEAGSARAALARGSIIDLAPLESAVVLAKLALSAGEPAVALRGLQAELSASRAAQHPATRIESLTLAAVSAHLLHDDEGALSFLEDALAHAQPEGYRLPLLAAGPPLRDLLRRRIRAGTNHRALAGELIQMLEAPQAQPLGDARRLLLDPLSDREEAVLRYLPTVMSKAEIASELFVSVNTVKTHTKNIYRKLGVGTRTDAVRRAKHLNLV